MAVLLIPHSPFPPSWRDAFEVAFRTQGLSIWPDLKETANIECVVMARPEPGVLSRLPNLKLISSTGMGVDHILSLPDLPKNVPIARVVTAEMVAQVAEYVVLAVLRVERDSDRFDRLQREGKWQRRLSGRPGGRLRIGLLGWGVIGRDCARQLTCLGFNVMAWARSERVEDEVPIFSGREGLRRILSASDILIAALPKTSATESILDAEALDLLPQNAHIINVGRGEHLVDDALLAALDSGNLSGATLDVFRKEPLPPGHQFWSHPKIRVTPHSAGMLTPEDSASAILRNLQRIRAGRPPENQINVDAGF